ncbi:Ser/Thr phosphatase 2C, putative [Giardia lamblia P15]|uniref:protein-serine/threonine phosphatase n=1 Tax=Giardia intestinalis (strain P15) TaxID=658858 RepID=E1EZ40_GIAIA|nr:Ser/Thr phosphatase 2C, putative [Giardia lamblia P15]
MAHPYAAFLLLLLVFYVGAAAVLYMLGHRRRLSTGTMILHRRLQVEYGLYQDRGRRPTMEDSHTVVSSLPIPQLEEQDEGSTTVSLFAIMDGHCGDSASYYSAAQLASKVSECWPSCMTTSSIVSSLHNAHTLMDAQFLEIARSSNILAGCTCLSTAIVTESHRIRVFTANLGDSRAILCRHGAFSAWLQFSPSSTAAKANANRLNLISFSPGSRLVIPLSLDQKPNISPDRERIEAAGAFTYPSLIKYKDKIAVRGPHRIFPGGLAVPRAIGDLLYKDMTYLNSLGVSAPLVSSDPVISIYDLTEQDEFILQACDGLWDVISSKEAAIFVSVMHYIHQLARIPHKAFKKLRRPLKQILFKMGVTSYYSPTSVAVAEALCNHAKLRGSQDNVTVSVIFPEFIKSKSSIIDARLSAPLNLLSYKNNKPTLHQDIETPSLNLSMLPQSPQTPRSSHDPLPSDYSCCSPSSILSTFQGIRGSAKVTDIDSLVSAANLIIELFSNVNTFDDLVDVFSNVFLDDIFSVESYVSESMAYLRNEHPSASSEISLDLDVPHSKECQTSHFNSVIFVDTIKGGEPLTKIQERTLDLWNDCFKKEATMSTLREKPHLTGITVAVSDFIEV